MDPNATWTELCEELSHLTDSNADNAWHLAESLYSWIAENECLPSAMEHVGRDAMLTILNAITLHVETFDLEMYDDE